MVKALVGDPYLTGIAMKNEISDEVRNNALTFKESGSFGYEELSFLSSMGIFGTNTLIYKTDKLEANDVLMTILSQVILAGSLGVISQPSQIATYNSLSK